MKLIALKKEKMVALVVPAEEIPPLPRLADGFLLRFKSPEGFKKFMLSAMEAAAEVWPEIKEEWEKP